MLRVLYLFPRKLYDHKMHRVREQWGRALGNLPDVRVTFWGPGWAEYDGSKTVQENIDRIGDHYDAIIAYGPHLMRRVYRTKAPRVLMFTDANHAATQSTIDFFDPALVVYSHEQDVRRWHVPNLVAVLHHCVERSLYYCPAPIKERTIECLFAGRYSPPTYMARAGFHRLLQAGKLPGRIRPHPGDKVESRDKAWEQLRDYAADLHSAKVFLTCCGQHGYFYQKYLEAFAAGCVVIGTRPRDPWFKRDFDDLFVEVDLDMCDTEVVAIVKETLADEPAMQQRADAAQKAYLADYTMEHYAERLRDAILEVA